MACKKTIILIYYK